MLNGGFIDSLSVQADVDSLRHLLGIKDATQELVDALNIQDRVSDHLIVIDIDPLDIRMRLQPVIHLPEMLFVDARHVVIADLVRVFAAIEQHFLLGSENFTHLPVDEDDPIGVILRKIRQ